MVLKGIRLGIFDHSGVLSDDRLPVYEANNIMRDHYGLPPITFEQWRKASQSSAGTTLRAEGVEASEKEIDAFYAEIYNEIVSREVDSIKPSMYLDAPEVLRELKEGRGFKLAVVSSHPKVNLERELEEYGLAKYFDKISGDPSPKDKRLREICQSFQTFHKETFFVEDTVYGLRSGNKAGVHAFGVTTGYHSRERLEGEGTAVAVVDSLSELLGHV